VEIEWGAGDMNRIYAMLRFPDKLHSKMDKWKNKIATYKDELTKEHPEVKRRTVELARLNAVKVQLAKVLKEINATFIQYRSESVFKKKELAEKTESLGKDHHVVKKLKREIQKLGNNMKHLVASEPDIAKAHNDVTRSKGELGKYKNVLVVSDSKVFKMEKQLSTYNRTYLRLLLRLRYKIDVAHKKLATYLCRNVRIVSLPKFETSRMVKNADRTISTVAARKMMNCGHCRFRKMLINKAALSSSCQVIFCDEHYTSKTCGSCGELHHNLGKNKTFLCPHCHYEADRDINAARNILLRFLTLNNIMFKRGSLGKPSVSYAPTASHSVPV